MKIESVSLVPHHVDYERIVLEDMERMGDLPLQKLLLSIPEVARMLSISRSKCYDLLRSGHLPSVYIGRSRRIRIKDLERFIDQAGAQH